MYGWFGTEGHTNAQLRLIRTVTQRDTTPTFTPERIYPVSFQRTCKDGGWFVAPISMQCVFSVTGILVDDATHTHLIERFHSEHADLFPTDIQNCPATEFLDRCAVVFECTACGSVYHFKDAGSHRVRCLRFSPSSWPTEPSVPAKHNIVKLVLSLLEVLELPRDTTLTSAAEALKDIRFVCLCGDPRYEGHFDFQGLVSTPGLAATLAAELVPRSLAMSSPRIKNTKRLNQRSLEKRGAAKRITQLSPMLNLSTTTTRAPWHQKYCPSTVSNSGTTKPLKGFPHNHNAYRQGGSGIIAKFACNSPEQKFTLVVTRNSSDTI